MRRLKSLWKVLFGRTTIFIFLLAVQAFAIIGGTMFLGTKFLLAHNFMGLLAVIILQYLLNSNLNSGFKMMWIIIIAAIPVFGVPFYLFTKLQVGKRRMAEDIDRILLAQKPLLMPKENVMESLAEESNGEIGMFKYIHDFGHYPAYDNASVKYFSSGETKFAEMLKQLESAKDFIFMEYFIVDKGEMLDQILEILKRKAAEGVEVRLMYDGTCMMTLLPKNYPKTLEEFGIKCKIFSPMAPFLTTHQNNRDHRKILVVDGQIAITGGVNIADEYINRRERFGHWKDAALMVSGEAVKSFTLLFLEMWNVGVAKKDHYSKYLVESTYTDDEMRCGGFIAPYGDSPLDLENVGEKVYLDILNRSRRYVHIMTPYLILDETMINALTLTSQKGVDVKLILPHIPDKKYAYWLARTHYRELISAGVKIYEYKPGFVHSKVFVSDDEKAVVGTINMDYRSLYLHFECAAYMWNNPVTEDIEKDFADTLPVCKQITLEDCDNYNMLFRILGRILKFVAPLM